SISISLIEENNNKDSSDKNNPPRSDLSTDNITNMIKKILSDIEDKSEKSLLCNNKYRKRYYDNISPVFLTNRKVSKIKKYSKGSKSHYSIIDLGG
ncbi:2876_t:CDS:1, partial [Diversispora eburnea]